MAEPQEGTSSVNPKDKKSHLDEDIGKDFLSSWKSMSVMDDDPMDFSFDLIPKGNKKKLNFDNLNVDFNLGGDFDKLTSFKVDMADLDFSCPPKKTANAKDKMKEEPSSRNQGKKEEFSFSFDFNELDNFNFDSSLMKEDKAPKKCTDKKAVANNSEGEDFKSTMGTGNDASEHCATAQIPKSQSAIASKVDDSLDYEGNLGSKNKDIPSISAHSQGFKGTLALGNAATEHGGTAQIPDSRSTFTSKVDHLLDSKGSLSSKSLDSPLNSAQCQGIKTTVEQDSPSNSAHGRVFKSILTTGNAAPGEDIIAQVPKSQSSFSSKVDDLSDYEGNLRYIRKDSPSNSASSGNPVISDGAKRSQDKTASGEAINHISETISTETVAPQPIENVPVESVNTNALSRDAATETEREHYFLDTKVDTNGNGYVIADNKMITCLDLSNEKAMVKSSAAVPVKSSAAPHSIIPENNEHESDRTSWHSLSGNSNSNYRTSCRSISRNSDGSEPGQGDLHIHDTSTSVSDKAMHDIISNRRSQNSTKTFSVAQSCSQSIVDKSTPVKGNRDVAIHSRFFKRPEETKTTLHLESEAGAKAALSASGTSGAVHSYSTDRKRSRVGESTVISRELTKCEPAIFGRKNTGSLGNDRGGFSGDGAQDGSTLHGNSKKNDREAIQSEATAKISVNNIKPHCSPGSQGNTPSSTEKSNKSATQTLIGSNNLKSSMASVQRSRFISSGRSHLTPLKPGKKLTDLSSMVIARNIEANKDTGEQKPEDKNYSPKNMGKEDNREPKFLNSVGNSDKHMLVSPSLKRKSSEAPDSDIMILNPLKRLSESPSESRNINASERVKTAQNKAKNSQHGLRSCGIEFSPEGQMADSGSPSVMDNDGTVEKAEAYAKELDNICNMLRKKHEEAKELLVRSIVNSNKLLMLNHPMHEEKIHMVQKFAAGLMLKELHT